MLSWVFHEAITCDPRIRNNKMSWEKEGLSMIVIITHIMHINKRIFKKDSSKFEVFN
jgi:hypothetical protein